jgi:TrmH family RNA methyltransferase
VITSRQHAIVKTVRAVVKGDETRALLDGWHLLHDAAGAGLAVEVVAFSGDPDGRDAALLDTLNPDVEIIRVSPHVMDALSPVRTPSGVVALVRRPSVAMTQVVAPHPALVLVGVDIQDPGNVGAMIRSAEAAGATGVVLTGGSADAWGWKALRAAMGSTFRLPVVAHRDGATACSMLQDHGLQLLAAAPRAGVSMREVQLDVPTAFLLGGEGAGLSNAMLELADTHVSIPMHAPVDSLNVAVTAALLAYEAQRQRSTRS